MLSLKQCIEECAAKKEFVAEFDRLTGSNLSRNGSGLELAIDDASGKTEVDAKAFIDFVAEYIWKPLAT